MDRAAAHSVHGGRTARSRRSLLDAPMGIADICEIRGDYSGAAKAVGRIVDLLENEWGLSEETDTGVTAAKKRRAELLKKA